MISEHAAKTAESTVKKTLGVQHWVHDKSWVDSLMLLESKPDHQHRRLGGRIYRSRRQDRAPAQGGGENRHAPGAGHDRGRHAGEAEGAPGKARIQPTSK